MKTIQQQQEASPDQKMEQNPVDKTRQISKPTMQNQNLDTHTPNPTPTMTSLVVVADTDHQEKNEHIQTESSSHEETSSPHVHDRCHDGQEAKASATKAPPESGRERLKRHRGEVVGQVWIPDIWEQEDSLKDWIDCSGFDAALVPKGIMSARSALVEEGRRASAAARRTGGGGGGGIFEGIYRVIMRRNSVYVTFVILGAFAGERAVDYGVKKIWEMNNVGE
ncbi:BIC1-like protein [Drosera capensis]